MPHNQGTASYISLVSQAELLGPGIAEKVIWACPCARQVCHVLLHENSLAQINGSPRSPDRLSAPPCLIYNLDLFAMDEALRPRDPLCCRPYALACIAASSLATLSLVACTLLLSETRPQGGPARSSDAGATAQGSSSQRPAKGQEHDRGRSLCGFLLLVPLPCPGVPWPPHWDMGSRGELRWCKDVGWFHVRIMGNPSWLAGTWERIW